MKTGMITAICFALLRRVNHSTGLSSIHLMLEDKCCTKELLNRKDDLFSYLKFLENFDTRRQFDTQALTSFIRRSDYRQVDDSCKFDSYSVLGFIVESNC